MTNIWNFPFYFLYTPSNNLLSLSTFSFSISIKAFKFWTTLAIGVFLSWYIIPAYSKASFIKNMNSPVVPQIFEKYAGAILFACFSTILFIR